MRVRSLLPAVLALLALYAPTYWDMAHGPWRTDEQAHAPLIALVSAWLAWRGRDALLRSGAPRRLVGAGLLAIGLLAYTAGRILGIPLLELGSQLPVLAGLLLWFGGWGLLRSLAFPLLFLAFMLPLPGVLVDTLTAPLKTWISIAAEEALYFAGYPVARSGVVLSLSQYRLLVADACSGLYSAIFLSALGLLYLHLVPNRPRRHKALLLIGLVPIALLANLARVLALLLITFHFGDAIGQGPLHDLTGVGVFVLALLLLFMLDALLLRILPDNRASGPSGFALTPPASGGRERPLAALVAVPLLLTAGIANAWHLAPEPTTQPDLEAMVPASFSGWRQQQGLVPVEADAPRDTPYARTLARTYVNPDGELIMLSIAYGANQLNERLHAHRPEYCYRAQGFSVEAIGDDQLAVAGAAIQVRHLLARRPGRIETITYWMVIGDRATLPGLDRKLLQIRHGLAGNVPDGFLVRVSSLGQQGDADALHARFVRDLLAASDQSAQRRLLGRSLSGPEGNGRDPA